MFSRGGNEEILFLQKYLSIRSVKSCVDTSGFLFYWPPWRYWHKVVIPLNEAVGVEAISTKTTELQGADNSFNTFFMWSRKNKVWMHYLHDIIAADLASGVFLAHFMRRLRITRKFIDPLEVIDLQRYRIIKKPAKINAILNDLQDESFVFVIGKN